MSYTFLVDPHLEVIVCSFHFGDLSVGVTSAGHCGVTFLGICHELLGEKDMVRRAAIKVEFPPTLGKFVALSVNEGRTFHGMSSVGHDHVLGGPAVLSLFLPPAIREGNSANFGDV